MKPGFRRRWARCGRRCALAALLFVLGLAGPARAQWVEVHAPTRIEAEAALNVFATWEGEAPLAGVEIDLPPGVEPVEAAALRFGYQRVRLRTVRSERPGRYRLVADTALAAPVDVIVQLRAQTASAEGTWQLVPLVRGERRILQPRPADAAHGPLHAQAALEDDNTALALAPGREAFVVQPGWDEGVQGFTLSLWMHSVETDAVVASAWTGRERAPYPLDLVVDASGRLTAYEGQPGEHRALRSRAPIADGDWRHVALVHDLREGQRALYVDGRLAERRPLTSTEVPRRLALAGRLPHPDATPARGLAGLLDEVRFFDAALTADDVQALADPFGPPVEVRHEHLSFEEPLTTDLAPRGLPERAERRPVAFVAPPLTLAAQPDDADGVRLVWQAEATEDADVFVVERSADGQTYDELARVPAVPEQERFVYRDPQAPAPVAFYRVRRLSPEGAERRAATVKVGLGAEERSLAVVTGNFPNPFSDRTSVAYELAQSAPVRLSVWSVQGHQVAVLVDEVQAAGRHEASFSAEGLPSGTYFVRLEAGGAVASHKMTVAK